jgi:hypothetical protein
VRRSHIVYALAFAMLAVVWRLWLGPHWTIRVPRDAVYASRYVGTSTNADPTTGVIPAEDVLSTYDRVIRVVDAADWPHSVLVQDMYKARDIKTGAVNFEYITTERVDPQTGAWVEGPHKGEIVLFPRNTEKRTYIMRSNYVAGLPLKFTREDEIGGLKVYLFSYLGRLELTSVYAGTPASPGVKVSPGQEIRCADDQFYFRAWVEPHTGNLVQLEEGCMSGDFIYDKVTGQQLAGVDRWNGSKTGGDLAARITEVYGARLTYLAALYFPGLLLLASVGIVAFGLSRRSQGALA